ncbi:MAG: peptide-methionine (S)-S-oxide reductase MsrA [Candidatus Saccharibacteria bacterium]|nr:peptide-methionine (S)-S-oxide reductase MsrA [Candidatus Saccharibacteria bacterium]
MAAHKESIVLGGGCFWCLDASYRLIDGVLSVESGYSGGNVKDPSYDQVCTGDTGHAEVVRITFDNDKIKLKDLLDIFWALHDPTTLNKQGNDTGTQYRSIILYSNDEQKNIAEKSKKDNSDVWDDPILTEILSLQTFYMAEQEHQDYFAHHPESAYCQVIINPKLKKLRKKFASRIRS